MTTYIKTIKTTIRKTNKFSGEMDDVVSTMLELKDRNLGDFYQKGMLIFIEDEKQIYKVFQKEILTVKQ